MTYSRAQMIEAWLAGYYTDDHELGTTKARFAAEEYVDPLQAMRERAARGDASEYVYILQDASPRLPTSFRIDEDPKYELAYQIKLEALDATLREHILKYQERELVLAKVLGSLLANLPVWVQVKNPDAYIDTMAHYAGELNRVFPELTSEE